MSPVIKLPAKSASKSSPAPAKPARKRTAVAKPAAPKATTPKRTPAKAAAVQKAADHKAEHNGDRQVVRRIPKDVDPKVLKRHETALTKAGEQVRKAKAAHDAAIDNLYETVQAAKEADVPMALIHEHTKVSRQWLYKMEKTVKRGGEGINTPAKSTAPATPARKRAAAAANGSKPKATTRSNARKGRTQLRVVA
jgi:hypothetical protein